MGGAPLALPSFVTPEFREFFRLGRVLRTILPTGRGGVVHLFVVYGYQGAEEDAEKLRLTGRLLQAVLAEAQMVCIGQPMLIAGDLNADPAAIPCLSKGISAGRYVDLALAYSLGAGLTPDVTCRFNLAGACAGAAARVCSVSSSSAVSAVAHAHASTLHGAHNSWSDTVRVQGPTGTRSVKGGVSGPAEDLRPDSEVEAGVKFRLAGGIRGQVAGTGTRQGKGGVVTPSLHPEVPGIQFVSPGYGLDIRQSMGWTKVCGTARSGICVLKGNAITRMLPENLDYLRVGWRKQGFIQDRLGYAQSTTVCVHSSMDMEQQSNHQLMTLSGMWLLVCGDRVAPLLSPWCARGNVPTGVNLNRYSGPSSCIRWHSDNEPLFGPQNAPKLIVSMSLGNSVEFKVRRGQGNVPSLITLDHGDLLVMDGLTQSEYVHCTASGLPGSSG